MRKNKKLLILVCILIMLVLLLFISKWVLRNLTIEGIGLRLVGFNPSDIELTSIYNGYKEFETDSSSLFSFIPKKDEIDIISEWKKLPIEESTLDYMDTRITHFNVPDIKEGYWNVKFKRNEYGITGMALCIYDSKDNICYLILYDL